MHKNLHVLILKETFFKVFFFFTFTHLSDDTVSLVLPFSND